MAAPNRGPSTEENRQNKGVWEERRPHDPSWRSGNEEWQATGLLGQVGLGDWRRNTRYQPEHWSTAERIAALMQRITTTGQGLKCNDNKKQLQANCFIKSFFVLFGKVTLCFGCILPFKLRANYRQIKQACIQDKGAGKRSWISVSACNMQIQNSVGVYWRVCIEWEKTHLILRLRKESYSFCATATRCSPRCSQK